MNYYNKLPPWMYVGSEFKEISVARPWPNSTFGDNKWFRSSTGDRRFLWTYYGTSNRINSWHGDEGRFKSKAGKNNK